MSEVIKKFNPPLFLFELTKVKQVVLNDCQGSPYPYEVVSAEECVAFYVADQEFLDLIKKRQPLYILGGTMPEDFLTREEG